MVDSRLGPWLLQSTELTIQRRCYLVFSVSSWLMMKRCDDLRTDCQENQNRVAPGTPPARFGTDLCHQDLKTTRLKYIETCGRMCLNLLYNTVRKEPDLQRFNLTVSITSMSEQVPLYPVLSRTALTPKTYCLTHTVIVSSVLEMDGVREVH